MPLPHYTQDPNSKASRQFEPVQGNLFEVTILPPAGVGNGSLLLQQVNTVSGLDLYKEVGAVEQKYKFAKRSYAGMPDDTSVDVTIQFSLNLDESNSAYTYKTLRDWYNKQYDPQTGIMGVKKDYVGTLVIVQYNRKGDVYRKVTLNDCFITSGLPFTNELNYETADAATLDVTWRSDYWVEEIVEGI